MSRAINVDLDPSVTRTEVDTTVSSNFTTVLKNFGHLLKGGTWDVTRVGSVQKRYFDDCYLLRNRVVHAGARITRSQLDTATDSHHAIVEDIETRLLQRRNELPRTAVMVFGVQGLAIRNQLSEAINDAIEQWKSEGHDWTFYLPADER